MHARYVFHEDGLCPAASLGVEGFDVKESKHRRACTLCVVKPHVVRDGGLGAVLAFVTERGFQVDHQSAESFCSFPVRKIDRINGIRRQLKHDNQVYNIIICCYLFHCHVLVASDVYCTINMNTVGPFKRREEHWRALSMKKRYYHYYALPRVSLQVLPCMYGNAFARMACVRKATLRKLASTC